MSGTPADGVPTAPPQTLLLLPIDGQSIYLSCSFQNVSNDLWDLQGTRLGLSAFCCQGCSNLVPAIASCSIKQKKQLLFDLTEAHLQELKRSVIAMKAKE
jgi:hypothetical protein